MSFSNRLAHHSFVLHCFYCDCQCGPSWSWMVRWVLLPFSSCRDWHGRILTVEYFLKVLLLFRLPPQFPCDRTYCMYHFRNFLQNPIPVCRIVLPTSWGRCEVESRSILQGPFYWRGLIQGKAEGWYSVLSVVQKYLEQEISRFLYCVSHCVFVLVKCVYRGK